MIICARTVAHQQLWSGC